jgi:ubiquinone/menaquinone biosynthesis C-methylase UbiE
METLLEEIRDQQKASWNKFSPGWKKWDSLMMDFLYPMGDSIINSLHLKNTDNVLDIASGTGEPGITIAKIVTYGKVTLTDLSEDMLNIAIENANQKGIKNIETVVCDVSKLPFADNTFDAISCRFGYMFFPDLKMATNEIARVLKPGGRFSTAVWGPPEKNFWVTAIGGTINRNMQLQPPSPEAPGMFRCAKSGFMKNLFEVSGLKNTFESEVSSQLNCKNSDVYWNMMTEVAAPFVAALSKADDEMKNKIKNEVFQILNEKYPDGNVIINASATIIYGEK